jgi:hypothetical protein
MRKYLAFRNNTPDTRSFVSLKFQDQKDEKEHLRNNVTKMNDIHSTKPAKDKTLVGII